MSAPTFAVPAGGLWRVTLRPPTVSPFARRRSQRLRVRLARPAAPGSGCADGTRRRRHAVRRAPRSERRTPRASPSTGSAPGDLGRMIRVSRLALTLLTGASQLTSAPGFVQPLDVARACAHLTDLDLDDPWIPPPTSPPIRPAEEPWSPPSVTDEVLAPPGGPRLPRRDRRTRPESPQRRGGRRTRRPAARSPSPSSPAIPTSSAHSPATPPAVFFVACSKHFLGSSSCTTRTAYSRPRSAAT